MLELLKEFFDRKLSKNAALSDNIFDTLTQGSTDLQPYLDVVNPKYNFGEAYKKRKGLPLENPALNKKFIQILKEIDPKYQKPYYETIINKSYQKFETSLKSIDKKDKEYAKALLEEIKSNALKIFKSLIDELENNQNVEISSFRMSTLIKILRGESICFITNGGEKGDRVKYIQFDKEYTSEGISRIINDYEGNQNDTEKDKHLLVARRHIDKGADLGKMEECLIKYKDFSKFFIKGIKPYIVSETWLNDINFFKFYEDYLNKRGRDPIQQKTIQNLNLTKRYSLCDIELGPLNKTGVKYEDRRRKFVKDGDSSLSKAIQEYESLGYKLQEGKAIIDLTKID